jgi:hypothetical protein
LCTSDAIYSLSEYGYNSKLYLPRAVLPPGVQCKALHQDNKAMSVELDDLRAAAAKLQNLVQDDEFNISQLDAQLSASQVCNQLA